MTKIRALFATIAAAALVALSPLAASASSGNSVVTHVYSEGYILVMGWDSVGVWESRSMGYGQTSKTWFKHAQKFRPSAGCFAVSQWGGKYSGGVYYTIQANNTELRLRQYC